MDEAGHGHLLSPETEEYTSDEGSTVDDIDTSRLLPSRRIIIDTAQRMQPEPQGLTAAELLNPCGATGTTPQHSTAALPLKQSPTPRGLAQPLSGRQMDASRNQRAQAKHTLSPAPVDPNKHAKTPTRKHMEPVRWSRSKHRCCGGGAQSQSRPRQNEVLIPVGYESTYRQECQKEEKQCRSDTLKWHLEKREPEKQEVLSHSRRYVSQCAREIKDTLQPMDKIVRGFKVFGDNAMIYTAPATSADLPRQCVHLGHQDVQLNSMTTWQWMANLLQFWKCTSSPASVDPKKHAKTPTREHTEPVRWSRSKHRCRSGGARSQSRPRQNEVLIPARYESTYRQERQKEEKQCRSDTLKWHLEKREPEKQEVLSHSHRYVSRRAREIKDTLQPMDKIVRGFKVFGDNAMIYTAPATSADLPRQCVHLGHQDVQLNSMTTWQWMADLLQFWKCTSSPASVDPKKHAKTPTREHTEPVRWSRSKHRCRSGGAWSQSRPRQNKLLIPAGYESTYRQECQKEEKQCRSDTLKWHLEKREAEKQEVLSHGHRYVS